jgi:hypothetical protein
MVGRCLGFIRAGRCPGFSLEFPRMPTPGHLRFDGPVAGHSDTAPTGTTLPVQSNLRTGNVSTESECGLWGGMTSWRFRTRRQP